MFHVLVKNYDHDELAVYGLTDADAMACGWLAGDGQNEVITLKLNEIEESPLYSTKALKAISQPTRSLFDAYRWFRCTRCHSVFSVLRPGFEDFPAGHWRNVIAVLDANGCKVCSKGGLLEMTASGDVEIKPFWECRRSHAPVFC